MSLRSALTLLAAAQAVVADSSHPMHFRKVDSQTAQGIAAFKNIAPRGDGALVNEQGFWFSHFTVGASKDLEILIDTGSSDAIMNPGIYQPSAASQDQNRRFHIAYATTNPDGSGTLSASGKVYHDVITQLGANLTVPQQVVGAIDQPATPPTFPHDGLIGYAGKMGASLREDPFFTSLCAAGTLSACRFGLALRTDGTGQLHYGAVATSEFAGALTAVKVTSLWSVTGGVTVAGKVVADNLDIATDSGTTVIFGPTADVKQVFAAAGVKAVTTSAGTVEGHYSCASPPTIGFSLGGVNFDLDPKALAFKQDGDDCTASVIGTADFGGTWLVGQAFFQGRYIDHNVDDRTMGFANLK
ncbi:aspartyl protease [Cordyceps fumosorosea ARSEF 2679]|uniref:Aspartyl protease n=1 Tax=Cordyceps fumosorosea (strain ARSEF 2679) TaxID=1081104 RepID=A0A168EQ80_CORFA|nr:aspartyl protease [Cordyceps fumosorosea ARSEF 2679]OAA74091.1 aspartyl protease [Cordyceps fumosorosea ARSEF 2679]